MSTSKRTASKTSSQPPPSAKSSKPRSGFYVSNGELHPIDTITDSSSSSEDEPEIIDVQAPRKQQGERSERRQVAKKSTTARLGPGESSHPEDSEPRMMARKTASLLAKSVQVEDDQPDTMSSSEIPSIADDDNEEIIVATSDDEDVAEVTKSLDALTLKFRQLKQYRKLPFLLRNLRKAFPSKCQSIGIPTYPRKPVKHHVIVEYRSQASATSKMVKRYGKLVQWDCPICDVYQDLPTRELLEFHLQYDHGDVDVQWIKGQKTKDKWRVVLLIPPPSAFEESESESEEEDTSGLPAVEPARTVPTTKAPVSVSPRHPVRRAQKTVIDVDDLDLPLPIKSKKFRERSTSPDLDFITDQEETSPSPPPTRSIPEGFPTPPPASKRRGPAARYPYLPEDGSQQYSCRPGGPKIYDLINTMSLEEYGVLGWQIIDREDRIFEMNDLHDEDKMILALWNRWVFLNRLKFVTEGYANGVKAFIEVYYLMIHKTAGWDALRAFILMLATRKFLTIAQCATLLKNYEEKVGMEYWDPV
ncbi:hypothetical protein ABKN59_005797 [Abortiporus biennis]